MKTIDILKENITYFNVNRFINILKIELYNHKVSYMISILITAVLYTFFSSFYTNRILNPEFLFNVSLLIGIVLSAGMFRELGHKEKASSFILTPGSNLEKWVSKFAISSVGYYLAVCLVFTVLILFFALLRGTFSGVNFIYPLKAFSGFMFFHALFFFGSIVFEKSIIIKTLLACLGIGFLLGILSAALEFMSYSIDFFNYQNLKGIIQFISNHSYLKHIASVLFTLLLYAASFLKLIKKEVY